MSRCSTGDAFFLERRELQRFATPDHQLEIHDRGSLQRCRWIKWDVEVREPPRLVVLIDGGCRSRVLAGSNICDRKADRCNNLILIRTKVFSSMYKSKQDASRLCVGYP
jgi:hypothetical protein